MIDVDVLFLTVNDLIRKDHQGGYTSNDEYNRALRWAQETLYTYCYDHRDETFARQSLLAFEKSAIINENIGGFLKPNDFKDKLDAYLMITGEVPIPVHFPARDEWAMSLSSPIRGGSLERRVVIGRIRAGYIEVDPANTGYPLKLNYYIQLTEAIRVVIIDVVTIQEVYDQAASSQLLWDEHNITDFTDLLLLYKGITIRDSALVEWVQAKNMINMKAYDES